MEKIISYLSYRIGSEMFATNVQNIQSIIELNELTKVPEMPSYFSGVMNLRGEVLPVIDSRLKLGLPVSEITNNSSIIVVEINREGKDLKVGLLVDEVLEVLEITDEEIGQVNSVGTALDVKVIDGVYPLNDRFIMLIDLNKLAA